MNMGSPNDDLKIRLGEGGGYACSTADNQDNTTWKEGRGIAVKNVSDNKCMTELTKQVIRILLDRR
jgi:hypothetical protein